LHFRSTANEDGWARKPSKSSIELISLESKVLSDLFQQIRQSISRQNYPWVSNPARTYNVSRRKDRSRDDQRHQKEEEMTGTLDWKWIGIGVVVMVVLNLIAGLILGLFLAPQLKGVASPENVELRGGQIVLAVVLNFLAFAIGGFIVGLKSAGRTILEPGISAAVAVLIALLVSGNFTVVNLLAVGLVPFIAGLLGGWFGERRQGTV
jgi:hypothetical protein